MYPSPSPLPAPARTRLAASLDARLADGLDLHSHLKEAHWNVKGPLFASLHPLFETFAVQLAGFNDQVAERAVTLGGRVHGTTRHVAQASRLPAYPDGVTRDLEHVRLLAERIEAWLAGARESRRLADELGDLDTSDLLTGAIGELEKNAWFLRATLET